MIKFDCYGFCDNSRKTWKGYISKLVYLGSHMEISVLLERPVTADVCKTMSGFFVYFAHYECGLNLCSLFDIDENAGRLQSIFLEKDAFTVAYAIGKVGNLLSTPRRKRRAVKTSIDEDELPF